MHMKTIHWTQHWHHISASIRLLFICIAGTAAFFYFATVPSLPVRLTLSWSIAGSLYLLLSYSMMYFSNAENILSLSQKEDDGAPIILLITVLASVASLVAIVIILTNIKSPTMAEPIRHIALVLLTYVISWLLVHTAFALHYAHVYYQDLKKTKKPALIFAEDPKPIYVDFLYFSIVIGMTCQTADVNIASSRMRYLVMVQGMIAFIFNATLLAMAINIISGVVALN